MTDLFGNTITTDDDEQESLMDHPRAVEYDCPWQGNKLTGTPESPLAFDTETEPINKADPTHIPRLALCSVSDGTTTAILRPDQLADFIVLHRDQHWVGHNFAFDFWVVEEYLSGLWEKGGRGHTARALHHWWRMVDVNQIHDTLLLDLLVKIGKGEGEQTGWDADLWSQNLARVAARYAPHVTVDKKDPFRLRYGELLGLDDRNGVDEGFFAYAATDAYATHQIYCALYKEALVLANDPAVRAKSYPDAVERYGLLTEQIQVKTSIAFAKLEKTGIAIDKEKAKGIEEQLRQHYEEQLGVIEAHSPKLLKRYVRSGQFKLTKKSGLPQFDNKVLMTELKKIAVELDIDPPISGGKKKQLSTSAKAWAEYRDLHPFLEAWCTLKVDAKELEFFFPFKSELDRVYPRYEVLKRTGRISAKNPNITQIPRNGDIRSAFIAAPGHLLLKIDYAAIELRTLAATCLRWLGRSRLAETFNAGMDPHSFTASMLVGEPYKKFYASVEAEKSLPKGSPKPYSRHRQSSKAVNFGVPGGLGGPKLAGYAKVQYGVTMTQEEAAAFRERLTTDIYPELNEQDGYLASTALADLACNLGLSIDQAYAILSRTPGVIGMNLRCLEKVLKGQPHKFDGTPYNEGFVNLLWDLGTRLIKASPSLMDHPRVRETIGERKPSATVCQLLFGSRTVTLTGRLRGGVGYTQRANTPFQGLASDGAKLAMWELLKAGHKVVAMVHDEVLVEVPLTKEDPTGEKAAADVDRILKSSMAEVLNNLVPVETEMKLAACWSK